MQRATIAYSIVFLALTSVLSFRSARAAQDYLSADPPPHAIEDRFRLEVDILHSAYDTRLRLDNAPTPAAGAPQLITPGTTLSGESDLGLTKSQTVLQAELTLFPGKHHLVRLDALSMRREGSAVLTRNVSYGSSNYLVGSRVDSHLNVTTVGLTYGYLPFRSDRYELGATFGIQIAAVDANAEVRSQAVRGADSGVAPIPYVGLEGRFDFTRGWSVDGRYHYFHAHVGDVQSTIADGRFALRWRQNQHLLYGLGYRFFKVEAISADTNTPGMVSLNMTGPVLFIQGSL